jgi:polysaccharide pyruvyl transferase WcaK-like protein
MKHITILNAYGDKNIGDAAILHMAISLLNEAYDQKCKIAVLCENTASFSKFIQADKNSISYQLPYGYAISGKQKRVSSLTKIKRFVEIFFKSYGYVFLHKVLYLPLPQDGFYSYLSQIADADLIVGMGGGYLTTNHKYKDYFGLGLTLLPIHIAKLYGHKQVLLPMSFGPFASDTHKELAYHVIKDTTIISRDTITLEALQTIDNEKQLKTYYAPDLALFFKTKEITPEQKMKSDYIVLTAREWFADKKKQEQYEDVLLQLVDTVWEKFHLKTVFIPMARNEIEDDDNRVAWRLQEKVADKNSFIKVTPRSLSEVQEILGNAKVAICTRMHSAILSTTVRTPFIAIGYGHKTLGFVKTFDIAKWHVDINEITFPTLYKKFISLSKEDNYLSFIAKVKNKQKDIMRYRKTILNELMI